MGETNRRNFYRLLHVQQDAPTEVIKASYRTLMLRLKHHPDLGGDGWNAALINEAYAVLSNPELRERYDRERGVLDSQTERTSSDPDRVRPAHQPPATQPAKPGRRESADRDVCAFCQTDNGSDHHREHEVCRGCGSPLTARGESRSYEGSTQSIRRTTLTRMAMGTRETDQPPLWIATSDLPTSPGHPFYARLTTLLDGHHFDRFVEGLCDRFYAPVMGRPSLAPGRYFRLLLVGYFEGIDSERGIAWRATDSLAVRSFLRLAVDEAPPDHSTIARTRRLIDLETHRTVFTWVQQRLVEAGRLTGKTIAIDATTLEANAAMRSIVRRDTGESYQAFLVGLATASGVETPTREGLARLDRKRKKKTSNTDWTHPHDPDAKVTKMKDGRTHLAHKAEHAVDMETGAIVAVTLQGADVGDTTTIIETAIAATEQVEDAQANVDDRQSLEEIVGDKGYHSNQTLIDLDAGGIRSYVSEPDRGRRDWSKDPEARAPVYGNRRRMRGRRGRRLMRQRGERIERSFAHLYDTGGMRRTHLRGHTNILKRLLIHAGGFNLGLVMRHLIGIGTPRGLQGRVAAVLATLGVLMGVVRRRLTTISSSHRLIPAVRGRLASLATFAVNSSAAITCTTGC